MTTQIITNDIQRILQDVLECPASLFTQDGYAQEPLTGPYFRLSAIAMTYLFFEVEKAFDIRLEEADVVEYRFNTIEQIVNTVFSKCAA